MPTMRLQPIGAAAAVTGAVLFVVAAVLADRVLFGIADLLIGAGLAIVALTPAPPRASRPDWVRWGFAVAAGGAIVDGIITLADVEGIALTACLLVIVGGLVVGALGLRPAT
jgi:hypothetical protein